MEITKKFLNNIICHYFLISVLPFQVICFSSNFNQLDVVALEHSAEKTYLEKSVVLEYRDKIYQRCGIEPYSLSLHIQDELKPFSKEMKWK